MGGKASFEGIKFNLPATWIEKLSWWEEHFSSGVIVACSAHTLSWTSRHMQFNRANARRVQGNQHIQESLGITAFKEYEMFSSEWLAGDWTRYLMMTRGKERNSFRGRAETTHGCGVPFNLGLHQSLPFHATAIQVPLRLPTLASASIVDQSFIPKGWLGVKGEKERSEGRGGVWLCRTVTAALSVASPDDMKRVWCENMSSYHLPYCFISLAKVKVTRCMGIPNPLAGQSVHVFQGILIWI